MLDDLPGANQRNLSSLFKPETVCLLRSDFYRYLYLYKHNVYNSIIVNI